MTEHLRWGILGAANFAMQHMARAIHAAEHNKVVALATTSPEKAAGFRAFVRDLHVHGSYDALLNDANVDAVYIPLPNHLHVEWTIKALEAGKHVLTEKPIAMRETEFDQLIAARDKTGLLAAEAYMIVHHPQWIKARQLYEDGAIGKLRHVTAAFSYNLQDMQNIRSRPETGGGSLRDIGVYTLGSTRFVTSQEPESVTADLDFDNGVDTFASVHAKYPSFTYSGYTSTRLQNRQEVVFHGDKGIMRLPVPFNANVFGQAELILETGAMQTQIERFPGVNQYVLQVENFAKSVRDGSNYPCTLEFSRGTQRMIDMVFDYARAQGAG